MKNKKVNRFSFAQFDTDLEIIIGDKGDTYYTVLL